MSIHSRAEQNFDLMVRNLDAYSVSNKQIEHLLDNGYDKDKFAFDGAVPDTCDKIINLINNLKSKGMTDEQIKDKIYIRPGKYAWQWDIQQRLKGQPVNIIDPKKPMPKIPLIPITNPAVSKRNADGHGRVDIYQKTTKNADQFRMGSKLPGTAILVEGWWLGGPFTDWLLPQVYKMVHTPGDEYGVKTTLWATHYIPGYKGPIKMINEEQGYEYEYDFAKRGMIIDGGSIELNDLLFDTQTEKKYIFERAGGSIKGIREHNKKSKKKKNIPFVSGLRYKTKKGKFIKYGKYNIEYTDNSIANGQDLSGWSIVKAYMGPDSSDKKQKNNPYHWKRYKLVLVKPGIYIPGAFIRLSFDKKSEAIKHLEHLEGDLVNFQNDIARRGKSISEKQTQFISHLDELKPLSTEQKELLKEYHERIV